MEPVSFVAGILSLAGLFNNALDCFEYVQLGRNFGKRFQTCVLKLDCARLRLSRWGRSVGLSGDINNTTVLQGSLALDQDIPKAEEILGQVLDLFAHAEGISTRLKARRRPGDVSLSVHDAETGMDFTGRSLHEKMRALSLQRQNKTSLRAKVKWVLYEEKQFTRLVEDVTCLIDELTELFPAVETTQKQLCKEEVSEIGTESLPMLKDVASGLDKLLEATILEESEGRQSQGTAVSFYGVNNQGSQIGISHGAITLTFGTRA
jgi:hypothetical protein